jgi:hypothetical protein
MNLTLKSGDHIEITRTDKRGAETFSAVVICSELRAAGSDREWGGTDSFQYFGYVPDAPGSCQWGYGKLYATPKPFGIQSIRLLDKSPERAAARFQPRPGDTNYDLMC